MKKINIILSVVVCVLLVLCVLSVWSPIRFEKECHEREAVVRQRLCALRTAAERFRHDHGTYTGRLQTLADSGYIADTMLCIPFSGGRRFRLEASAVTTKSGRSVPVMECSATYDDYLRGLDASAIRNLNAAAAASGRFPGLKIGDLAEPNDNNGNWE